MAAPLNAAIETIGRGEHTKPPPATDQLSSIGTPASQTAVESITNLWASAADNLPTALSVTSTQVKVIEIEAKSQGREPTDEELDEACGPLAFLAAIPKALNEALGGILESVGKFASDFGESIGEFAGKLNKLIDDVANAVDEIAQEAAQLVLDAFKVVNDAAVKALEAVEGAINTVVGVVNNVIAEAEAALNRAIDKLLSFADTLNFASLFSLDCQKEALENAVDTDKIADADEVNRVLTPDAVDGVDPTITSETLSTPQTTFETPRTPPPKPTLEQLKENYRTASRALRTANEDIAAANAEGRPAPIRRAELDALVKAQRDALQELRVAALAAGKNINDLKIHGRNFDEALPQPPASRGTDAAKPKTEATGPDVSPELENQRNRLEAAQAEINRLQGFRAEAVRVLEGNLERLELARSVLAGAIRRGDNGDLQQRIQSEIDDGIRREQESRNNIVTIDRLIEQQRTIVTNATRKIAELS